MRFYIPVILFISQSAIASVGVKIHFTPIANLVYQLDCVSKELPHCSRETYQDLWQKNFLKGPEDEAMVKSWGELMSLYSADVKFEEPQRPIIPGRFEGLQISTKIRIASFQSTTKEDYFQRLDLVVRPKDRAKFEKVIRHFYSRFEKWWTQVAQPKGKSFAAETDRLLRSPKISNALKQFANFYHVNLPENYVVHFNLFYRPDFKESTSGQQIENYSIAEFLHSEKPMDRIDVIVHELCHFFFESSTDEEFASLQKAFESTGKVEARSAFNLLNEGLATAMGNGVIAKLTSDKKSWEKYYAKPLSFYNNEHIDKTAKSILPWLEVWLKESKTLYEPEFVEKYLATLEQVFGKELSMPKLILNELVFVADGKFEEKLRPVVREAFRTASMYASQGDWSDEKTLKAYIEQAKLSALLIVHAKNISRLKDKMILSANDFDIVNKAVKEKGQVIYSFRRSGGAPAFLIVARTDGDAKKMIEQLASLKEGFAGVLVHKE